MPAVEYGGAALTRLNFPRISVLPRKCATIQYDIIACAEKLLTGASPNLPLGTITDDIKMTESTQIFRMHVYFCLVFVFTCIYNIVSLTKNAVTDLPR